VKFYFSPHIAKWGNIAEFANIAECANMAECALFAKIFWQKVSAILPPCIRFYRNDNSILCNGETLTLEKMIFRAKKNHENNYFINFSLEMKRYPYQLSKTMNEAKRFIDLNARQNAYKNF
jgi:hypothetical protein